MDLRKPSLFVEFQITLTFFLFNLQYLPQMSIHPPVNSSLRKPIAQMQPPRGTHSGIQPTGFIFTHVPSQFRAPQFEYSSFAAHAEIYNNFYILFKNKWPSACIHALHKTVRLQNLRICIVSVT